MHPTTAPERQASARGTDAGTVVGAIPARFASTRLPGKPLLQIAGRPMIEHVYRRARAADALNRVVVLTDDERIAEAVDGFGGEVEMTPETCVSGTDRIAWAARSWNADAVVNIQGDEPLIDPETIDRLARHLVEHPSDPMVTLAAPAAGDEASDSNAVKVVCDLAGYALYFSRAAIPFPRGDGPYGRSGPLKHVGIYGYQRDTLLRLAELEPTPLERMESLEQLRALENGIRIRVLFSERRAAPGVDTEVDRERVEQLLSESAETDPVD